MISTYKFSHVAKTTVSSSDIDVSFSHVAKTTGEVISTYHVVIDRHKVHLPNSFPDAEKGHKIL